MTGRNDASQPLRICGFLKPHFSLVLHVAGDRAILVLWSIRDNNGFSGGVGMWWETECVTSSWSGCGELVGGGLEAEGF